MNTSSFKTALMKAVLISNCLIDHLGLLATLASIILTVDRRQTGAYVSPNSKGDCMKPFATSRALNLSGLRLYTHLDFMIFFP